MTFLFVQRSQCEAKQKQPYLVVTQQIQIALPDVNARARGPLALKASA